MHHISSFVTTEFPGRGGGRVSSPAFRASLAKSTEFRGLEEGAKRYELLQLAKRVGMAAGFTPRMLHLLEFYMAYTRDCDWEQGSHPIVYQSLTRTAMDLGVSEVQIQKLEARLFEVGAITWKDSANHKRYGTRDEATGRILLAYGVDLAPLALLRPELERKLEEKRLYDEAWRATKRQISELRRQIRSTLLEWGKQASASRETTADYERDYDAIAVQLRSHIDLATMRSLLVRHECLYKGLLKAVVPNTGRHEEATQRPDLAEKTLKGICTSQQKEVHIHTKNLFKKTSNPSDTGFQESVAEPAEPNDSTLAETRDHINLRQVLIAASDRFRGHLPLQPRPLNWDDVFEAACRLRPKLHISQQSWGEAARLLGRERAALCILITDAGLDRESNSVKQPSAYFRGMVNKARAGELHLHNSMYGLIERENLKNSLGSHSS
jgi:replication initiation protein RepC